MQTRVAVIVTLALCGVVAAVMAARLVRAVARYVDTVERFAAAVTGCLSLASTGRRPEPGTPRLSTGARQRRAKASSSSLPAH